MKSASPNLTDRDNASTLVIDVTPITDSDSHQNPPPTPSISQDESISSALTTTQGSFASFLAPLSKDTLKEVVKDVEGKLQVVNQTLGMLDSLLDAQGFDSILNDMLKSITLKTGELLNADRTTIFLLDEDKNELWSLVAKDERGNNLELRFPATVGIAGEVATLKKVVNIPFDFYDDPRSATAKKMDIKNGYRTYTMLALPLLNEETDTLVAVVQLINKLKENHDPYSPLADKIDTLGFTAEDEKNFREFAPSIRLILESSKSFYAATQRQRAASALMEAVNSLSKSSLDLEDTLKRVMDQAKELMNADRSTLWLLDEEKGQLWTKIPINGVLQEIRIPGNAGFAGIVAQSREPLMISFDLYDDPRSEKSKEVDQKSGYRTCSMLCMPVFNADNQLIGVTQLINKKRQGEYPPYNPEDWPHAPEQWRASFNRNDMEFMQAFNVQAGVALQNAKLFAEVKQQKQMQEDILRSLTNGVISTDRNGLVIAANDGARQLLAVKAQEIEGMAIAELVKIKGADFSKWLQVTLSPKDEKDRQQYYPDQTLFTLTGEEQSVNISLNSMADVVDASKVSGALVVMEDISGEKQVKNLMYRYMTPEVAEQLLASGDTGLGGKRKHVSVLFSDIRSYTTLTEKLQAEEVVTMLNEYFERMVDAVFKYGGTLDKYIGDALMAVFGSPAPLEEHSWCAIQTAIEMRQRLQTFNAERKANNLMPISIGMGIHSDEVVSGNIGSSKRMELTSIGDGVNLASRLEGTSKQYGTDLVISESTYRDYADRLYVRELDFITVKGKSEPVTIYELVGIKEGYSPIGKPLTERQEKMIEHYQKGREYYKKPVLEKLTKEEITKAVERVKSLSNEELKTLSFKIEEQLELQLKKLLYLLKKLPDSKVSRPSKKDELIKLLKPEIKALGLEGLKNLSEDEARLLLRAKVTDLSADDLQLLPEGDLKNLLEESLDSSSKRKLKKLSTAEIKQLLEAKIKSRSVETIEGFLDEEFPNLSLDQVKKLLDEVKKLLEPKARKSFKLADQQFQSVLEFDPKNKAAKLHIERCMLFQHQPPDVLNWDGVWKLTEK